MGERAARWGNSSFLEKRQPGGQNASPASYPARTLAAKAAYYKDGMDRPIMHSELVRAAGLYSDDWFPIQVKQMDKVGRPDIDAFEAVMEREGEGGRQRGFFVSFGYTKDAEAERAAFHKRTGRIIKLLTVQEILDEAHVQKL